MRNRSKFSGVFLGIMYTNEWLQISGKDPLKTSSLSIDKSDEQFSGGR